MMTRGDGEPFVEEKSSVVAEMLESQWVEGLEHGSACTCKISILAWLVVVGLILLHCGLSVNN